VGTIFNHLNLLNKSINARIVAHYKALAIFGDFELRLSQGSIAAAASFIENFGYVPLSRHMWTGRGNASLETAGALVEAPAEIF
jgi:hypothetical protein